MKEYVFDKIGGVILILDRFRMLFKFKYFSYIFWGKQIYLDKKVE